MRKSKSNVSVQKQLSNSEMAAAITKIDRRLIDLKNFNIESVVRGDDPNLVALEHKIDQLLLDIFGAESTQYNRYWDIKDLYHPSLRINYIPSHQEMRTAIKANIDRAIVVLDSIKSGFKEELGDNADVNTSSRIVKAYSNLDLHPMIAQAASQLYFDEHYANAIEDAVKALNNHVRLKSSIIDKDGVSLMQYVFSENNPILQFNDLIDTNDRNEQKGFMQLFCGAVTGLRNPRAHKIIDDDAETTLEFIAFISLLAKLVDKAFHRNVDGK